MVTRPVRSRKSPAPAGRKASPPAQPAELPPSGPAKAAVSVRATRGERTKEAVKLAIAKLAAKHDLADITLSDICRVAKVTTGAVYFHFKDKDEAVEAMVIDQLPLVYDRLAQEVAAPGCAPYILALIERIVAFHLAHKRLGHALQMTLQRRPLVYQAWLRARQLPIDRLTARIAHDRAAKGLPVEPAGFLAHHIFSSIEDLAADIFQWKNPILAPFAADTAQWCQRQAAFWAWSVLAPIP